MATSGEYCSANDVLSVLTAYDLSKLGDDTATQVAKINNMLPRFRMYVDRASGRRKYGFYEWEDTVEIDGTGDGFLNLRKWGLFPIISVTSITVNDTEIEDTVYEVYQDEGYIVRASQVTESVHEWTGGTGIWPKGYKNIVIDMSWGYEDIPEDIRWAQAQWCAAEILASIGGATSGGYSRIRIGDYSISYGREGPYAVDIERLLGNALKICGSYHGIKTIVIGEPPPGYTIVNRSRRYT